MLISEIVFMPFNTLRPTKGVKTFWLSFNPGEFEKADLRISIGNGYHFNLFNLLEEKVNELR